MPMFPWAWHLTPAAPEEVFPVSHASTPLPSMCDRVPPGVAVPNERLKFPPLIYMRWENKASYQSGPFTVYELCPDFVCFQHLWNVGLWLVGIGKQNLTHKSISIPLGAGCCMLGDQCNVEGVDWDSLRRQTYLWRRRRRRRGGALPPASPAQERCLSLGQRCASGLHTTAEKDPSSHSGILLYKG